MPPSCATGIDTKEHVLTQMMHMEQGARERRGSARWQHGHLHECSTPAQHRQSISKYRRVRDLTVTRAIVLSRRKLSLPSMCPDWNYYGAKVARGLKQRFRPIVDCILSLRMGAATATGRRAGHAQVTCINLPLNARRSISDCSLIDSMLQSHFLAYTNSIYGRKVERKGTWFFLIQSA